MDATVMEKIEVKADLTLLNNFIMALTTGNGMSVRVGVLANKNARTGSGTNASIGAKHEFGSYSDGVPKRSFLRMPLTTKSAELLKTIMAWAIPTLVKENPEALLKKIGVAAEGIVADAFKTGGFGTWQPISDRTAEKKKSRAILIETSQLQRSITSDVVKGGQS